MICKSWHNCPSILLPEIHLLIEGFVGGFGVSLLGAVLLFLGATGAFASTSLVTIHTYRPAHLSALFAVGTILSLVGTGFLMSDLRFFFLL